MARPALDAISPSVAELEKHMLSLNTFYVQPTLLPFLVEEGLYLLDICCFNGYKTLELPTHMR